MGLDASAGLIGVRTVCADCVCGWVGMALS